MSAISPVVTPPLRSSPRSSFASSFRVTDTRRPVFFPPQRNLSWSETLELSWSNKNNENELLISSPTTSGEGGGTTPTITSPTRAVMPTPARPPTAPSSAPRKSSAFTMSSGSTGGLSLEEELEAVSLLGEEKQRNSFTGSGGSNDSGSDSFLVRRLHAEVYAQRPGMNPLPLREDIDMNQQLRDAKQRKADRHAQWVSELKASIARPDAVLIRHLKCLVIESQRYQEEHDIDSLKVSVVLRAVHTMGPNCPPNFYRDTKPSDVLFNDIDHLMSMPEENLPQEGPVAFATREVFSFPLWHQQQKHRGGKM